ncbi:MAG: hypothetical protein UT63_C0068G0005 [Candidatus Gottesmanbacteria bacterium GW2011_GWC2_39_8]|uniref:Cytochrome b5 heme-binding domain-containing protein n=1 Tax=Candidatus Gottesmanbacteria bacterium GW2011_GWC2_39_8 TaxID=1618450 RepID=A0A0G0S9Q2_9BACT|nr:MAG: hypothetical protein UT63_C0068G0005 [Candidatus Gottesmanbacteria bacterium GW2011_GWC2_39_8]
MINNVVFLVVLVFAFSSQFTRTQTQKSEETKVFKVSELSKFNGTDPNKPIYIAYNGEVYDVSGGRNFYKPGGTYHFLAGRDSTSELNIAGGAIIKRKYPVIGVLRDNYER